MAYELDNCPACNVSLNGDLIPADIAHHYSGKHWRREIGIYNMDLDRTTHWRCPDCEHEWPVTLAAQLTPTALAKLSKKRKPK